MAVLLLANGVLKDRKPDVVYCARYYYQGKRPSTSHLYICRHDGARMRQLTFGSKASLGSFWLDSNRIAFVEFDHDVPISFSYGTLRWIASFVVLDCRTGSRRTLGHAKVTDPSPMLDTETKTIYLEGFGYKFSDNELEKFKPKEDPWPKLYFRQSDGSDDPFRWQADVPVWNTNRSYQLNWKMGAYDPNSPGSFQLRIRQENLKKTFSLKRHTVRSAAAVGASDIFVVTEPNETRVDCEDFLYRLDFRNGTSKLLVTGVGDMTIDPVNSFWLGTQTETPPVTKLKDGRRILMNELYAGDWKSKKRWTLATGPVFVSDYHFRPPKG